MMYALSFRIHKTQEDIIIPMIAQKNGMLSEDNVDGLKDSETPKFKKCTALFDCLEDANAFIYGAMQRFGVYFFIVELIKFE